MTLYNVFLWHRMETDNKPSSVQFLGEIISQIVKQYSELLSGYLSRPMVDNSSKLT